MLPVTIMHGVWRHHFKLNSLNAHTFLAVLGQTDYGTFKLKDTKDGSAWNHCCPKIKHWKTKKINVWCPTPPKKKTKKKFSWPLVFCYWHIYFTRGILNTSSVMLFSAHNCVTILFVSRPYLAWNWLWQPVRPVEDVHFTWLVLLSHLWQSD